MLSAFRQQQKNFPFRLSLSPAEVSKSRPPSAFCTASSCKTMPIDLVGGDPKLFTRAAPVPDGPLSGHCLCPLDTNGRGSVTVVASRCGSSSSSFLFISLFIQATLRSRATKRSGPDCWRRTCPNRRAAAAAAHPPQVRRRREKTRPGLVELFNWAPAAPAAAKLDDGGLIFTWRQEKTKRNKKWGGFDASTATLVKTILDDLPNFSFFFLFLVVIGPKGQRANERKSFEEATPGLW